MTALGPDWQKRQAAACSCKGTDEYCPCQNVDFSAPKATRPSAPRVMDREALRQKVIGNIAAAVLEKGGQLDVARLADAILALSATSVDVGEVVKSAYLEGLGTGPDGGQTDDGGERCWLESDAYAALHDRLTGKDRG